MTRIKCFYVEQIGERRTPCTCGDSKCTSTDARKIYKRMDTGEECDPWEIEGAMFFVDSKSYTWQGPDGKCLVVVTPAGPWFVDSVCSNCTRKEDKVHKCWVRHGEAPNITVDKNGDTCAAGAGSIMIRAGEKSYHGMLRNGVLEEC